MTNLRKQSASERGFSVLELMIVVLLLTIVTGAVFTTIAEVQNRYRSEEMKLDITQTVREAADQFLRDLHQAGYPNTKMYASGVLMSPPENDNRNAVGLVAVSSRDIWFEGDLDGDGAVESVRYRILTDANGTCPCQLQRSQQTKVNGTAPTSQTVSFQTLVDDVLNSGSAGGPLNLSGSMDYDGAVLTNNVVYATYRTSPVFSYFDNTGTAVVVPADLAGGNLTTGSNSTLLDQIRSVRLAINVFTPQVELDTNSRPVVTISAAARVNN